MSAKKPYGTGFLGTFSQRQTVESEAPRRVLVTPLRGSNDTPLWKEVPPVAVIMPPPLDPTRYPAPDWASRFWSLVDVTDSCWLWRGPLSRSGYGTFGAGYRSWGTPVAHRLAYLWTHGEIPDGLVMDHLCRVRHCVRVSHLEPITNRENVLRGDSLIARYAARTHCAEGHELPAAREDGARICLECLPRQQRAYRFRQPSESPNSAPCSACGMVRHVRVNGSMHRHKLLDGGVCPGSGLPPRQAGAA